MRGGAFPDKAEEEDVEKIQEPGDLAESGGDADGPDSIVGGKAASGVSCLSMEATHGAGSEERRAATLSPAGAAAAARRGEAATGDGDLEKGEGKTGDYDDEEGSSTIGSAAMAEVATASAAAAAGAAATAAVAAAAAAATATAKADEENKQEVAALSDSSAAAAEEVRNRHFSSKNMSIPFQKGRI